MRADLPVALMLPPYREFLSQLPVGAMDDQTAEDIQQICALPKTVVNGTVKGLRTIPSTDCDDLYTVISLSVNGKLYEVLHADFSSALHTTDLFLIDTKKVQYSALS